MTCSMLCCACFLISWINDNNDDLNKQCAQQQQQEEEDDRREQLIHTCVSEEGVDDIEDGGGSCGRERTGLNKIG